MGPIIYFTIAVTIFALAMFWAAFKARDFEDYICHIGTSLALSTVWPVGFVVIPWFIVRAIKSRK